MTSTNNFEDVANESSIESDGMYIVSLFFFIVYTIQINERENGRCIQEW